MDPTIFWQGSLAIPNNILLPIQAGFPRGGGANPNLLFDNFFAYKNCMKMKEIGLRGSARP